MPLSITAGRGIADTNLSIIAGLFILSSLARKDFKWLNEPWLKIALVLYTYIVARSLFVDDIIFSVSKVIPWLRFVIFAAAMQNAASKQEKLFQRIFVSLAVVVGFLAADAIYQFFAGQDLFGRLPFDEGNGTIRLTGPYSKKIVGTVIMTLSAPVLAMLYYRSRNSDNQMQMACSIFFAVLIYLSVFLSGERSAFIQITITILLLLFILNKNKFVIIAVTALVAASVAMIAVLHPALFQHRFYTIIEIATHLPESVYGKLWISALEIGINNPIFGIGGRYFEQVCSLHSNFCAYHPHNIYLEWFSEFGIVGLSLFLLLLISILKTIFNAVAIAKISEIRTLAIGTLTAILIKLLPFLPSSGFFKNWYATPLWFMIGFGLALSKKLSDKKLEIKSDR